MAEGRIEALANHRYQKKYLTVLGREMAYIDEGAGDPIVFLHGNPTSSFLWRNVMPYLAGQGRLIAIDAIGMGDSDKIPGATCESYCLAENSRHTFALLEALGVEENVTLILHDWGSGVGFHWAHDHPAKVKGLAFMEAIPTTFPTWNEFPAALHEPIQMLRSTAGERAVLEENFFIETLLPSAIMRDLTAGEHAEYRRPFERKGEDRLATLAGPRGLPIAGEPAGTVAIVEAYSKYLEQSRDVPKLFINADPGAFLVCYAREFVRTLPNLTEVTVTGSHFVQEDSPHEIGIALRDWLAAIS